MSHENTSFMLSCLIYTSEKSLKCTTQDVYTILEKARENNKVIGVTGVLLHSETKFMQYIEGGRTAIFNLYDKIKNDTRHTNVVMLKTFQIEKRLFPSWEMGSRSVDETYFIFEEGTERSEREVFKEMVGKKELDEHKIITLLREFA